MNFDIKPRISTSEKDFFLKLGPNWLEIKNNIHSETIKENDYCCQGCGYRVMNQSIASRILGLHLVDENEENPEKSFFISLCKACHTTQHIDVAINQDWVMIVNSSFSQKSLIEMCRINSVSQYLKDGEIRILKTTPIEYLESLKNNTLPLHSRVKVIFTKNFEWGDL